VVKIRLILIISIVLTASAAFAQSGAARPKTAPTPNDDQVQVFTEEIRLNISALDPAGKFATDVKKEDLVINEDGRIHQADSIRRVPANVLIILDTGGEERRIKGLNATRQVAKSMVDSLNAEDSVALMEFNDKADILAEWTSDKARLQEVLDKKLGFGHRARLIEALELLAPLRPGLRMLVAGRGDAELFRDSLPASVSPRIELLGQVDELEKASMLRSVDVYCAPNTGQESFGVILLEAMAAGTPIVASDLDAFRRVLDNGRAGRQFVAGDPVALAGTLGDVLDNAPLREGLTAAGRLAVAPYDWSVVSAQVMRVYELAIAGASRG